MYQAVQVAYTPAAPGPLSTHDAACLLTSNTNSDFAAAAAGLAVAQQAAALGVARMQVSVPAATTTAAIGSGIPGLAKTLAVETGMTVQLQQQEQQTAAHTGYALQVHGSSSSSRGRPAFSEGNNR